MIKKMNAMDLGVFLLIRAARVLYTPLSLSFVILCRDSVGSLGPICGINEAKQNLVLHFWVNMAQELT